MHARTAALIVAAAALAAVVAWLARSGASDGPGDSAEASDTPAGSIAALVALPDEGAQPEHGAAVSSSASTAPDPVERAGDAAPGAAVPNPVRLEIEVSANASAVPPARLGTGPYILGRAVDGDGMSIGSAQLIARLDSGAVNVPTSADGSFAVPMGAWMEKNRDSLARHRAYVAAESRPGGDVEHEDEVPTEFRVDFGVIHAGRKGWIDTLVNTRTDVSVGDVTLRSSELIASGRVVDERGEPAVGAAVEAITPLSILAQVGIDPRDVSGQETTSQSSGRFELFGWGSDPRVALRVHGNEYAESEPIEVARGATDVVLTVPRSGSAKGRVLVAKGVDRFGLHVEATQRPAEEQGTDRQVETREDPALEQDGRFEIRDLHPGVWFVVLRGRHSTAPLCEAVEIDVSPGETVELEPFDLRDRLWTASFAVVGTDGSSISNGRAYAIGESSERGSSYESFDFAGGQVAITTLTAPDRIVICAPGQRDTELDPDSIPSVVEMRAALSIAIEAQLPAPLPAQASLRARLRCLWMKQDPSSMLGFDRGMRTCEADGTVRLDAGRPGIHEVSLSVAGPTSGGWIPSCDLELPDSITLLSVEERNGEQRFSVPIPLAEWKRALAKVGL